MLRGRVLHVLAYELDRECSLQLRKRPAISDLKLNADRAEAVRPDSQIGPGAIGKLVFARDSIAPMCPAFQLFTQESLEVSLVEVISALPAARWLLARSGMSES
ncbi:hypothetical protein WME94_06185 [Sorangium sp. So ce429]